MIEDAIDNWTLEKAIKVAHRFSTPLYKIFQKTCTHAAELEQRVELQNSAIDEVKFFLDQIIKGRSQYSFRGKLMANGEAHAIDLLERLNADFRAK